MEVMDPLSPHPELGLKERFFRYFQHEVTALQEQIGRLSDKAASGGERQDAVDHCLAGIARLSHEVKDASSYIPAYDQRTYAEAIKALSDKLNQTRSSFAPRSKFTFKSSSKPSAAAFAISHNKNPSAISLNDAAELASQQRLRVPGHNDSEPSTAGSSAFASPTINTPAEDQTGEDAFVNRNLSAAQRAASVLRKPSFSESTSVMISGHSNLHIILPSSASHATSSGTLMNLRHCIVDMSQPTAHGGPFAGLTVKNIKSSLVVCGKVAGPIHLTGLENCVVVVSCRQFRMHECNNVNVYLHCSSRPIIESCANINFAPLPTTFINDNEPGSNLWDQVDDFKWLKSEPSPHWKILASSERVQDGVWKDLFPGGPGLGLEGILKAVNISNFPK
ncbi:putative tubulin-specific chaperone c [Saccharata proteae CBS 121410]|uniref:Tubulin-specific chaperone c n=1 Tax=Saccharata proteae CBS 121410 TaxID=1314787 RepID=A0A9P4HRI8_9PEZI|nr:putative tubulin-specific chaperone c [Saccharata proteae CBS 121410]